MSRIKLKNIYYIIILICSISFYYSNIVGKVSQKIIMETVERAIKYSGRENINKSAKMSATKTLEKLVKIHGKKVISLVDDGGIELLEKYPKYGDELIEYSLKVSPKARKFFALNVDELLPLAKNVGVEVLELEAKAPGLASKVYKIFGNDIGKKIAINIPSEDIPRILKYAEKADSPQTLKLLLEKYKIEGKNLFNRLKPNHILAFGLTSSMLYGTHRITEPAVEIADQFNENKNLTSKLMGKIVHYGYLLTLIFILLILWRFNLMPWHRKKVNSKESDVKNQES